ncbi:hypothetical protein UQW22_12075 [Isoptericola halotolerans]|uniref:AMIN-like domain-containing (lipo)protein n=1 Tax=Isoptericola halotolerans TaxID=300560 RepID=UPI00388D7EFD
MSAAALVVLLAACGGGADLPGYGGGASEPTATATATATATDDDTAAASPTPDATATEDAAPEDTPAAESPAATEAPFEGGTAVDTGDPSGDALLTVTDVRVGLHEEYDRVVFDLEGTGTPGWRVEYVEEALEPGRGDEVEVDGDAVLEVGITGTAMPMDSGVEEYGGDPVAGPGESVEEVVYRFVFEGTATAFVGVDGEPRPFRVLTLSDPTRMVVDVGH